MADESNNTFLKRIDQYALPIQLKYKMKVAFTSYVGGITSIIIYILFGAVSVYLFVDMTDKGNQNIVKFPRRESDPPKLSVTSDNRCNLYRSMDSDCPSKGFKQLDNFFFWAFTFQNKSSDNEMISIDEINKIFSFDLRLVQRNSTTGIFTDLKFYEFKRCGEIYAEFPFESSIVSEGLCLNETNFSVEGDFISPLYTYLNIKFNRCKNSEKLNCYSSEEILNKFSDITVNFVGTNFFIDPRIVEYSPFIEYSPYYLTCQVSSQVYQKYDIYLSQDQLISQENLIIPSLKQYAGGVVLVKKVNPLFSIMNSNVLLAFYLRSNYNYDIYHRSYKSFVEVVAQIGGIWKVLYLIGALFMIPLNSKLLMVSLGNKMFNLINPDQKYKDVIAKDDYTKYSNEFSSQDPEKILKLNNKTKLEAEMSIDYYKYERHRGIEYSVKEAFASIFCIFCKSENLKSKEKILEDAQNRLYNKLNTNNIFKFSVQIGVIKRILLGKIKSLISYSTSSAIHTQKIPSIQELMRRYNQHEEMDGVQTSLYKEVDLISGLRALQTKPMLDERVDINLLQLFKFKESHIKSYFTTHYTTIKNFLDKITVVVESDSDPNRIGRRRYLTQKEINLKMLKDKEKKKNRKQVERINDVSCSDESTPRV